MRKGLLDPESFTQDNEQGAAKFYRGETYVLSANYQNVADMISANRMQDPNAELYFVVYPGGPKGHLQVESSRLENGLMISQNALDELGVEGETYELDDEGNVVLNSDIYYNGINPDATKQLNVDYGFGGGVFAYGGARLVGVSQCFPSVETGTKESMQTQNRENWIRRSWLTRCRKRK